ncbi:MAG TPA: hypothetical protein VFJ88_09025 [Chthoniobacterales bacterium]|jgi:hypothetical protein|nr:hypothetical protein [Chthoniobacterales bacterium]
MSHSSHPESFIPPHGGYENLLTFRKARIIYEALFASASDSSTAVRARATR